MIGLSLFVVTATATLGGLMILCMVAARDPSLLPATVNPFAPPPGTDPTADTLRMADADPTLAGDWHKAELTSLSAVEELLDVLEARRIRHREMEVVGNAEFVVRWR